MKTEFGFLVDNLFLLPIFQAISLLNGIYIYTRIIKHHNIVEFLRMILVLVAGGSGTGYRISHVPNPNVHLR